MSKAQLQMFPEKLEQNYRELMPRNEREIRIVKVK